MTILAKERTATPAAGIDRFDSSQKPVLLRLALSGAVVATAVAIAPETRAAPALATLGAILCSIFLFPKIGGLPSHTVAPPLGACVLLLLSHAPVARLGLEVPKLAWNVVWDELAGHAGVPILILSFAYLSISLDDSGFFNWCSLKLMRAGRGSGRRLIMSLFLGVSLITFFTSNDIVILSVTPILIYLGNNARIKNLVPFLMAQFIAANTASMGLYIGNPTNMVIGNAVGIGFFEYAQRMFVPTLVATLVALLSVLLIFTRLSTKNRVTDRYVLPPASDAERWTRHMTLKVTIFGACLILLSVFGNPWLLERVLETENPTALRSAVSRLIIVVSTLFALLALVYDTCRDSARGSSHVSGQLRFRMRRLPLEILPFFLSFCVILRGLEEAGLTRYAIAGVVAAFEHGPLFGSLATAAYAVLAVNLTNNIPATILFEKTWLGNESLMPPIAGLADRLRELHPSYADIFIDGCLFGSNFGANLTFIGALAGLMWLRIIRDHAHRAPEVRRVPEARDFLTYGALIVPLVTAATSLAIGLSRGSTD
jgi:arsenical pump membrane protein